MRQIQIILSLLLFTLFCQAQSINGLLIDNETNEGIPFANVVIYNNTGEEIITGGTSDSDGKFIIQVDEGDYQLMISTIGYAEYAIDKLSVKGNIDLGEISLAAKKLQLAEVQVTAERSYIEQKPGKQILNVGQDISSRGGNILAVMKALPSVEVTPRGDLTIRGNSNIKILINGKQPPYGMDPQTLLKQLPASSIERIEVITNATAKDDPETAGGAINVITKKSTMDGFNIAINLEGGTTPFRGNAGVSMNYAKDKLNTYLNYSYYQEKYLFDNEDQNRYNNPDELIKSLMNKGKGNYIDKGHLLIGGLDYDINENSKLNLELMHNDYKDDWRYSSTNKTTFLNESSSILSSLNSTKEKINFTDLALNYAFENEKRNKLDIKTHFTKGGTNSNRTINKTDENQIETTSRINEKGIFNTLELTVDYSQPIGENGSLETGIFNDAIWFDAKQNVELGEMNTLDYTFNQHRHAIYAIYEHQFGNFSASIGARGEYYFSKTKEEGKDPADQKYTSFFPNLKLQYDLSNNTIYQSLNLSYARSLRRPSYEELDPNIDYSNPYHLEQGNPNLNPEFIDKLELGHTYSEGGIRINSTLFASITNDVIQQFSTLKDDGVILSSYANYSKKKSVGLEINSKIKPFKWWHFSPAGIVILNKFAKPKDIATPYNKTGSSWNASISNTFKINSKHILQLQGFYYGKNINANYSRNAYSQVNIGYEYSMLQGLATLSASVTDIFNSGGKEKYQLIGKGITSDSIWKLNNRFFKVGLNIFIK